MSGKFGKSDYEWAWEFHKNCDSLLHQRLASFTAAQAMTLAAFTLLTVARFNASGMMEMSAMRINLLEWARALLLILGLLTAIMGLAVTAPMLARLEFINNAYLNQNPVYEAYKLSAQNSAFNGWYKYVIPRALPAVEIIFWLLLLLLLFIGIKSDLVAPILMEAEKPR